MKLVHLLIFLGCSLVGFAQKEVIHSNANWPVGIAEKDGFLYIAEGNSVEITRIDLNDPNLKKENFLTFSSRPIYLEVIGDYLYFSGFGFIGISRIDLTDANATAEVLVPGPQLSTTSDFILDGSNLYYTQPQGIYQVDISATDPVSTILVDGQNSPKRLLKHGDYLYFSELWEDRISRINLLDANPTVEVVLSDLAEPSGLAIHKDELFFIQYDKLEISKINLNESPPAITTVDTEIGGGDLLFVDTDLYVTSIEDGLVLRYNNLVTVSTRELSQPDFKVYPNPTKDFVNFEADPNLMKGLSVFEASGGFVSPNQYSFEKDRLDLSLLSAGIYFVKIIGEDWVRTKKIIRL